MSKSATNSMLTATKLSDAQMSMLNAAAQREDRCLTPLHTQRGAQVNKAGEVLISAGFVREVKAKGSCPVWRHDGKTGAAIALKLSAAGAKAVAQSGGSPSIQAAAKKLPASLATGSVATPPSEALAIIAQGSTGSTPVGRFGGGAPRPTSKIAAVIRLLSRSGGATLAELIAATGWLPHTTRAALTGLRKRGYCLTLDRSDRDRGSLYRIASKPADGAFATRENSAEAA